MTPEEHRLAGMLARTIDRAGLTLYGHLLRVLDLPDNFAILDYDEAHPERNLTASMKLAVHLTMLGKLHKAAESHKRTVAEWDRLTAIGPDGENVGGDTACGEAYYAMEETQRDMLEIIGYGEL